MTYRFLQGDIFVIIHHYNEKFIFQILSDFIQNIYVV